MKKILIISLMLVVVGCSETRTTDTATEVYHKWGFNTITRRHDIYLGQYDPNVDGPYIPPVIASSKSEREREFLAKEWERLAPRQYREQPSPYVYNFDSDIWDLETSGQQQLHQPSYNNYWQQQQINEQLDRIRFRQQQQKFNDFQIQHQLNQWHNDQVLRNFNRNWNKIQQNKQLQDPRPWME